jgi:hypothetical protein
MLANPPVRTKPSKKTAAAGLCLLTVAVLAFRQPDQFLRPYIWGEDGLYNLPGLARHGLWILFEPIAGYEVLAMKLLSIATFKTSVLYAPEIGVVLATALTCVVVLAVALSPTYLPAPFLCAVAVLLIPTDPEVFAVVLHAFQWAGLLLLLARLWRSERQALRWAYILFGGLSSPIIVPIAGVMTLRAIFDRTRAEIAASAIAIAVAVLQTAVLLSTGWLNGHSNAMNIPLASDKLAGLFFRRGSSSF